MIIDDVWEALQKLPRPVTEDLALQTARHVLDDQKWDKFQDWWRHNGTDTLARLNA